jgi:hypothetical protein
MRRDKRIRILIIARLYLSDSQVDYCVTLQITNRVHLPQIGPISTDLEAVLFEILAEVAAG